MAKRTYAALQTVISAILQNVDIVTFSTTELDVFMPEAIPVCSRYRPHQTKETLLTSPSAWVAATAYVAGDRVRPTTANGHVYLCTTAGTSHATTEPTWPITVNGTVTESGSTLAWNENGLIASTASKDLTLSTENLRKLLWIEMLEYEVAQDPQEFPEFTRWGDVLTMDIDSTPVADESVYLYLAKKHILQKAVGTTTLTGDLSAAAAAGVSSIAVHALGTLTINEDTTLMITGDTTVYTVTETVTISGNAATIKITPVTSQIELIGAAVTLSLATSTMDDALEEAYCEYVAATAALSKPMYYINTVPVGGSGVPVRYGEWGREHYAIAMRKLQSLAEPRAVQN